MDTKIKTIMFCCIFAALAGHAQKPSDTPKSQMEKLDRGLVVIPVTASNHFVSWRLLGTDDNNTTFELLKNGESLKKDIYQSTSMSVSGSATDTYQIVTYQNGKVVETTDPVKPWDKYYLELKLDQPAAGALGGTYSPNDCSVGDVDGDGQYEVM